MPTTVHDAGGEQDGQDSDSLADKSLFQELGKHRRYFGVFIEALGEAVRDICDGGSKGWEEGEAEHGEAYFRDPDLKQVLAVDVCRADHH